MHVVHISRWQVWQPYHARLCSVCTCLITPPNPPSPPPLLRPVYKVEQDTSALRTSYPHSAVLHLCWDCTQYMRFCCHDLLRRRHSCQILGFMVHSLLQDVAIAYGYNNVGLSVPATVTVGKELPLNQLVELLRMECAMCGFTEILTWALCSRSENFEHLRRRDDGNTAVSIGNPATAEFEVCRTSLLQGMLAHIITIHSVVCTNAQAHCHLILLSELAFCFIEPYWVLFP